MTAEDLRWPIREAFHIATTGRPGPSLVDIPKDVVADQPMEWYWPTTARFDLPGYQPDHQGPPPDDQARRPS